MMNDADFDDFPALLQGLSPPSRSIPRLAYAMALRAAGLTPAGIGPGDLLMVQVPGPSWISPVMNAASVRISFDERYRPDDRAKSNKEAEQRVLDALSRGKTAVAVADFPATQAPRLLAAADHVVTVSLPGHEVLRAAIRLATGKYVREVPAGLGAGLDLPDICAAIRIGSTPAQCIARLSEAGRRLAPDDAQGVQAPPLEALHGYGKAMDWCLGLVRDIGRWRDGTLPFGEIDRACVWASDPGLGKTSLARSLARSAGLPLVATSVGAWFAQSPGYLDSVIKQIDAVLNTPVRPAIVFLDELEALPDRRTLSSRGRDWWTPVVTYMLTALDGAVNGPASQLIVIGATNHPDRLDPALIRPGRLNRVITIGLPDAASLAGILRQHLGDDLPGADLSRIARLGGGATGAEAAAWVRDARGAARNAGRELAERDLLDLVDPPSARDTEAERITAVHEASHAVVGHVLGLTVERATIVPRGPQLGSVSTRTADPRPDAATIERLAAMLLAGRAGEILAVGSAGAGAADDLGKATQLVAAYHASFGFGASLVSRSEPDGAGLLLERDPELRRTVDAHLGRLHAHAVSIIQAHRPAVEALARALLRERVLDGGRVRKLLARKGARAPRRRRSRSGEARPAGADAMPAYGFRAPPVG